MSGRFVFSGIEKEKNDELMRLFDEWIAQISKSKEPVDNGDGKRAPRDCFAKDGFFPGYFSPENKKKVLFIGRETRNIGGYDFRDTSKDCFEKDFYNGNNWWRHILYIVYGIHHGGKIAFSDIPQANEIVEEMLEKNEFSFAVVNVSKFSNDSDTDWQTNTSLVDRFLKDSELEKTNFFQRELDILEPDVIITANLWDGKIKDDYLELCLPSENFSELKKLRENVAQYGKYNMNGKKIDYIDLYHFSAVKNDEEYFYNPVMKILFGK